jgi:hypothetical protein
MRNVDGRVSWHILRCHFCVCLCNNEETLRILSKVNILNYIIILLTYRCTIYKITRIFKQNLLLDKNSYKEL